MKQWPWISNPFIIVLRGSMKRALKVSTYTFNRLYALKTDPVYGPMYTEYAPIHQAFSQIYTVWKNSGGLQKGSTLSVNQLLDLLSSTKLHKWGFAVEGIYARNTPDYVAIFPQGHQPFHNGNEVAVRLQAIDTLATALKTKTPLATTYTEVNAFNDQIGAAYKSQQGSMGTKDATSASVMAAGLTAMQGLFKVMSDANSANATDPSQTGTILDLVTLRNHDQVLFTGVLAANEIETIAHHTFVADDEMIGENTGDSDIIFYIGAKDGDLPGTGLHIKLGKGEKKKFMAAAIGDVANNVLMVMNTGLVEGHFSLRIL